MQRRGDAIVNLVLHCEQVARFTVEAFRPQMRAAVRIDQLCVDPDLISRAPGVAFKDIANAESAADLLGVIGLSLK